MNGKKAKRMRAAARSIETTQPWVSYIGVPHTKTVNGKTVRATQVKLHPHCGRKFYKEMKQGKRAFRFVTDAEMARIIASGNIAQLAG